ncbi:MAG: hypothetical protein ACRDYE_14685 [Acidimicrobiales bacterium]
MIFRTWMDFESSDGMVRDAGSDAYEFSAKSFAVGPSVRLVVSGEYLEPPRDVEPKQCGPNPCHVDRLVAGGHVAQSKSESRVIQLLLDEGALAEPRPDVDDVAFEVGDE